MLNRTVSKTVRRTAPNSIGEVSPRRGAGLLGGKAILALGADIKNRFLLARGSSFHFGPDIGDLSRVENFELFKKAVRQATKGIKPDIIACDLHPGYFSTIFAKSYHRPPATCRLLPVQHHHAHIASVMQEHNLRRPVLGVAFDGTGYGEDAHSWGGEFLLVNPAGFKRLAHLKYRMMPGADKVVSEPWRMLLSILGKRAAPFLTGINRHEQALILKMLAKEINSPRTSSAGRLFDAAAALLGICLSASYEAEGPIKLEDIANERAASSYSFGIVKENGCFIVDTDGIFLGMLNDLKRGLDKAAVAGRFHNSMAQVIVRMVKRLCGIYGIKTIALSGGVFQNKFLKTEAIRQLTDSGFKVFTNINTPVNDLNISLGQYHVLSRTSKS